MREIPCYLKGQLSKNLTIYSSVISGIDRLEEAFKILDEENRNVDGRYVMVECHNNQKMLGFYQTNGFKYFVDTNVEEMIQFIRNI